MELLFNRVAVQEIPANRFSCEFCTLFKNAFYRTPKKAASAPCKDFVIF